MSEHRLAFYPAFHPGIHPGHIPIGILFARIYKYKTRHKQIRQDDMRCDYGSWRLDIVGVE
jgi:hypothetical protein